MFSSGMFTCFMHARDYASLNGLSQSTATRELRHDLHGSATITSRGEKSAKIYLLKEEPQAAQPPVSPASEGGNPL